MSKLYILIIIVIYSFSTHAQTTTWENHYRSPEVEINVMPVECHDAANGIHKKLVLLQFVNLTPNELTLSYDKEVWYDGKCAGCGTDEQRFTITLPANGALSGSCDDKDKSLYIVDKMLNVKSVALTKFELKNIRIITH